MSNFYDILFNEERGVAAVSVHCTAFSNTIRLTPEMQNKQSSAELEAATRPGKILLLHPDVFKDIRACESAARTLIRKNSIPFALLDGVRLVRVVELERLYDEFSKIVIEHDQAKAVLRANYDTYKKEHRKTIEAALRRLMEAENPFDPKFEERNAVLEDAMDTIDRCYPSAADAANKFTIRLTTPARIDRSKSSIAQKFNSELDDKAAVIGSVLEDLAARLKEPIDSVIALVERGSKLSKKTTNAFRAKIDQVRSLNIFGDPKLESIMTKAEALLSKIDSDAEAAVKGGLALSLKELATSVDEDIKVSVEEAEARLTSYGKRRMVID